MGDVFWTHDPMILLKPDIIPSKTMSPSERLNALSRLLIITTFVLYMMDYDIWLAVFILGALIILILRTNRKIEGFAPHRGNHDPCHNCGPDATNPYINSKYETSPQNQFSHVNYGLRSYANAKYKVIPFDVPSPYQESWRTETPFRSEFSEYPQTYDIVPPGHVGFNQPANRRYFEDRSWVLNSPQGKSYPTAKVSAMPAVQSAFMRDSMEFRNNIMGEYIDTFARQRQHNCVGFKPGRKTF